MNTKKLLKFSFVLLFSLFYVFLCIYICKYIEWDADKANHLLQAKDIVSGNVFLRGWTLTGVSFITTDLIFYAIGFIVGGISKKAIYISAGLMISTLFLSGLYVSIYGKETKRPFRAVLYVLLMSIPSSFFIFHSRVHNGAYIYTLFSILIASELFSDHLSDKKKQKTLSIVYVILVALGSMGDILTIIYAVIPILIYSMFQCLTKKDRNEIIRVIKVSLLSLGGVIISFALNKIYFSIGKADKNSYLSDRTFNSSDIWGTSLSSFVSETIKLSDSNFGGLTFADPQAYFKIINALFLFVSFLILDYYLYRFFFKRSTPDILSTLISLSALVVCLVYIFTDMSEERYIFILYVYSLILLVRNIEFFSHYLEIKQSYTLIIILAALSFCGKVYSASKLTFPDRTSEYISLASFLEESDLHNGYASFWNASPITVASEEKVKLRHVWADENAVHTLNWFKKDEWFEEIGDFVVVKGIADKGASDINGISTDNIISCYGNPEKTMEYNDYIILVYDHPLVVDK